MLYFIHLPKTAGTSFRSFLQDRLYGDRLHLIYHDLGYWNAAEFRARLTGQEVFYGHFCYGLHRLLRDPLPRYATMLRHPVDRVVSLYKHFKRDPATGIQHEIIKQDHLSLREFVESGISMESNNHYTKMLSANYARVYRWLHHASTCYARHFQGQAFYQVHGRRHLRRALKNLRANFAFIGFTDRFDSSMRYLLDLHNLPAEGIQIPLDNISGGPAASPLDAATLRAIETANDLDLELYHTVRNDPASYRAVVA